MVKTKLFSPALLASAALMLSLGTIGLGAGMVHASTFGTMQGKVTDAAGQPVAGVKLSLAGEGSVTTDKSGSYILDGIDPGTYQLEASKKGYQSSSLSVTILQDVPQEVDVTLTPAVRREMNDKPPVWADWLLALWVLAVGVFYFGGYFLPDTVGRYTASASALYALMLLVSASFGTFRYFSKNRQPRNRK